MALWSSLLPFIEKETEVRTNFPQSDRAGGNDEARLCSKVSSIVCTHEHSAM